MPRKKDRWPELCDLVASDDGLPVRSAGSWTEAKLFYWNRYLEITTTAMVGSPLWPGGIVYVDLFGGPGVLKMKESGRRIPGSALIAAQTPKPFDRILICEKSPEIAKACKQRLKALGAEDRSTFFLGDCNEKIEDIVKEIPKGSLTVAFIDPEGLHAHFETIRKLTSDRRVDLLVLFADKMDLHRNIQLYADQKESNIDRFLGPDYDWRTPWNELPNHNSEHNCEFFANLYRERLANELGYEVFADRVMRNARTAIYRVIFASKSTKGLEFWNNISKIDPQGQKNLFDKW